MFRITKRYYSLRDSPNKLSASPSLTQLASPCKRLKLFNSSPRLSSTLLQECSRVEEPKMELEVSVETGHQEVPKSPENISRDTVVHDEPHQNQATAPVETPPPTPEFRLKSRLEMLAEQKARLEQENKELDTQLDQMVQEIMAVRTKSMEIRASRFVYDDLMDIINMGQTKVRDQLNKIFYQGNEIANKANSFAAELQTKHQRKLEKLELELNNLIESSQRAIGEKMNSVKHEIDLHNRTLAHKEELARTMEEGHSIVEEEAKVIEEDKTDHIEEGTRLDETSPEKKSDEVFPTNQEEEIDKGANSDSNKETTDECIYVDDSECDDDTSMNINADSNEGSVRTKGDTNVDDEDTDIDETQNNDSRPFTPMQAQRLE